MGCPAGNSGYIQVDQETPAQDHCAKGYLEPYPANGDKAPDPPLRTAVRGPQRR